jgi:hypothetical protein
VEQVDSIHPDKTGPFPLAFEPSNAVPVYEPWVYEAKTIKTYTDVRPITVLPSSAPSWIEPLALGLDTERIEVGLDAPRRRWLGASVAMGIGLGVVASLFALAGGAPPAEDVAEQDLAAMIAPTADSEQQSVTVKNITKVPAQRVVKSQPKPKPAAAPVVAAEPEPAKPTTDKKFPFVSHIGETSIVKLSFDGTSEGHRAYLLADPAGVAINVPNAIPSLDEGVHAINAGLVKRIWIRNVDSGYQIRVLFKGDAKFRVKIKDGAFFVALDPK